MRADHDRAATEREKDLEAQIAVFRPSSSDANQHIAALNDERDGLRKHLDDTTALAGELKKRLEKLGQNVDKLTSEKGQLAQTLEDAKARLEELRRQKAAAEARAATFRNLVARLRSMIDAGQLKVVIRDGRMLIALPNDVLFDSGKTSSSPTARRRWPRSPRCWRRIPDRKFLVAGDTDDVPIHTVAFPVELGAVDGARRRGHQVPGANGMKPEVLAAAGYGEFDPMAANDTPEHRAQNRRIEIVLQPNLADFPSLEAAKATP